MALQRNLRYPGRFSNPTTEQPQGAFKNRTAPGVEDGSYMEQDWLNDIAGFLSYLLTKGGVTPSNTPDSAVTSQYFEALAKLVLSRTNPFADIKADGTTATALANLGLSGIASGTFPIGMPFYWPNAAMPNTLLPEWSDMVFLKWNNATFSATTYPKLALVIPSLQLTEARGEFIRVWDDGRNVDTGRALLSTQGDAIRNITGTFSGSDDNRLVPAKVLSGAFYNTNVNEGTDAGGSSVQPVVGFDASRVVPTATENRPRNITFNLLVRAK